MSDDVWTAPLIQAGFRVYDLTAPLMAADWANLAGEAAPAEVRVFAGAMARGGASVWDVLVESAASVNPGIRDELAGAGALAPLRALLARTEHAAIVYDAASRWKAPNRWGYTVAVRRPTDVSISKLLLLHPPAQAYELQQVGHVLAVKLPPSYRRFLLLTNGLDAGHASIAGAGPQRAHWNAIQLNLWMALQGQNEVAARWREFQGTYAYERIMDRERGENTFASDETTLIPFAHTYEDWCFDRARPDGAGEYPILLWDHEERKAIDRYTDFDAWFSKEFEPYIAG